MYPKKKHPIALLIQQLKMQPQYIDKFIGLGEIDDFLFASDVGDRTGACSWLVVNLIAKRQNRRNHQLPRLSGILFERRKLM
jgi:hypothetical protein